MLTKKKAQGLVSSTYKTRTELEDVLFYIKARALCGEHYLTMNGKLRSKTVRELKKLGFGVSAYSEYSQEQRVSWF